MTFVSGTRSPSFAASWYTAVLSVIRSTTSCRYSLADLDLAGIIEATAARRVLVVGSLPPAGRDWDLLVHNRDRAPIEARLSASGFVAVQRRWVRPSKHAPDVVELLGADEWRL